MDGEMTGNQIGPLLKNLLGERSLSIRKFSELTGIDAATISRIINGKRKATPEHLQSFAACLGVSIAGMYAAAGYPLDPNKAECLSNDLHSSLETIQDMLQSFKLYNKEFKIESVEKQLDYYNQFSQTEEGKNTIIGQFEEKLSKVGSLGPFISRLNEMFADFCMKKGSPAQLAIMGSALLYFIVPVDVIPDYLFPIGYIDDAVAVQLALNLLIK